jgi:hypothetical protein
MLGSLRRVAAAAVFIVLGLGLLLMARSPWGLAWGACAVALLANVPRSRAIGLAAAALGLAVGLVLATQGIDSPDSLLAAFFRPEDTGRWYVVMPIGWGLAILSGIAGTLLLLPFRGVAEPR